MVLFLEDMLNEVVTSLADRFRWKYERQHGLVFIKVALDNQRFQVVVCSVTDSPYGRCFCSESVVGSWKKLRTSDLQELLLQNSTYLYAKITLREARDGREDIVVVGRTLAQSWDPREIATVILEVAEVADQLEQKYFVVDYY